MGVDCLVGVLEELCPPLRVLSRALRRLEDIQAVGVENESCNCVDSHALPLDLNVIIDMAVVPNNAAGIALPAQPANVLIPTAAELEDAYQYERKLRASHGEHCFNAAIQSHRHVP